MALGSMLFWLVAVVLVEMLLAAAIVDHRRFARLHVRLPRRLRESASYVVVLVGVLLAGSVAREVAADLSWVIGLNITAFIQSAEQGTVALIQSVATPPATAYFSFVYVFGYPLLTVFPVLLYAVVEESRPFRELVIAFVLNDVFGVFGYVLFVSYGPRNTAIAEQLLYTTYPQAQFLTAAVNANSNVFPSLHTSISVTVAYMAWRTRHSAPRWWYLAAPMAASIAFATMYLGIHWVLDVVAGTALGVGCVRLAVRTVDAGYVPRFRAALRRRLSRWLSGGAGRAGP